MTPQIRPQIWNRPWPKRGLLALLLWAVAVATAGAAPLAMEGARIVDSAGRRVAVARPFERIISLYGAHTENLYAMGAQDRLVGVTRHDDYPPEVKAKPVHSYHDDLERFLVARPDLVLIRPMIDRGYGQLIRRLEGRGITVISLQPATPEQMLVYWKILGRLTGREAAAGEMVARFEATSGEVERITRPIKEKKRVYFEAIHHRMRTFAPTAMPMFVLETAGGINVAADAAPRRGTNIADYGKERILSKGARIDVYLAQYGPMNRPTREMIQNEPGYGAIRAVRDGHIFLIDEKLVSRPTLRMLTGMCLVGRMLYPDLFAQRSREIGCEARLRNLAEGSAEGLQHPVTETGTRK